MSTYAPWEQKLSDPSSHTAGLTETQPFDVLASAQSEDHDLAQVVVQPPARGLSSQVVLFLAIGVASTLAYLLLYVVLGWVMPAQAANALSLLLTAIANTAANRRLTFGVRGSAGAAKQQVQGLIAFGAGLVFSSGALVLLHAVTATPGRIVELTVLVVANLVATVVRFVLYRLWVFRR